MNSNENMSQEIIIIKRGNQEEEGHHGGAWKIAFADFMTAMMALFLVLWLINAANEETKRAVASYFNPVKLVDRNRSTKGVDDQKGGPTSQPGETECHTSVKEPTKDLNQVSLSIESSIRLAHQQGEAAFFADPYASIEAIERNNGYQNLGHENAPGAVTADTRFPDPFTPPKSDLTSGGIGQEENNRVRKTQTLNENIAESSTINNAENIKNEKDNRYSTFIQNLIFTNLRERGIDRTLIASSIDVVPAKNGVLISIKDLAEEPMFEIGSSIPAPSMVYAVKAIAKTLMAQNGNIRISGHTDARIFQNEIDGNWRLSADRARSTYFILLDGGIPDSRIFEISGFADRNLKKVEDPFSGENRRIEILLEQP